MPKLFPQLAKAPLVNADDPTSLIRVVLSGSRAGSSHENQTGPSMPAFGWNLGDQEIASVLTYVRNSWGNAAAPVAPKDVGALRKSLQP